MLSAKAHELQKADIAQLRLMQTAEAYTRTITENNVDYFEKSFFDMFYNSEPEDERTAEDIKREMQEDIKERGGEQ